MHQESPSALQRPGTLTVSKRFRKKQPLATKVFSHRGSLSVLPVSMLLFALPGVLFCPSEESLMKSFVTKVQRFLKSEDGPTAVEYAIMLALIVIVCLTAIRAVGTAANAQFQNIADEVGAM